MTDDLMNSCKKIKRGSLIVWLMGLVAGGSLQAATLYVSPTGGNVAPYTSWATAAHVIQDAVDQAVAGDTVLVTNGIYNTGGGITPGFSLFNRVVITNAITLQSVNGPESTTLLGEADPGTGGHGNHAVRGVYLVDGASLVGFTVSNGYTRTSGDYDRSGGGFFLDQGGLVSNSVVVGNSASAYGGGGVCNGGGVRSSTALSATIRRSIMVVESSCGETAPFIPARFKATQHGGVVVCIVFTVPRLLTARSVAIWRVKMEAASCFLTAAY